MHPTHPRRRPWPTVLLLVVTALLVALAAVVLVAPPAGADSLGGAEPSNYQTRVLEALFRNYSGYNYPRVLLLGYSCMEEIKAGRPFP